MAPRDPRGAARVRRAGRRSDVQARGARALKLRARPGGGRARGRVPDDAWDLSAVRLRGRARRAQLPRLRAQLPRPARPRRAVLRRCGRRAPRRRRGVLRAAHPDARRAARLRLRRWRAPQPEQLDELVGRCARGARRHAARRAGGARLVWTWLVERAAGLTRGATDPPPPLLPFPLQITLGYAVRHLLLD